MEFLKMTSLGKTHKLNLETFTSSWRKWTQIVRLCPILCCSFWRLWSWKLWLNTRRLLLVSGNVWAEAHEIYWYCSGEWWKGWELGLWNQMLVFLYHNCMILAYSLSLKSRSKFITQITKLLGEETRLLM